MDLIWFRQTTDIKLLSSAAPMELLRLLSHLGAVEHGRSHHKGRLLTAGWASFWRQPLLVLTDH